MTNQYKGNNTTKYAIALMVACYGLVALTICFFCPDFSEFFFDEENKVGGMLFCGIFSIAFLIVAIFINLVFLKKNKGYKIKVKGVVIDTEFSKTIQDMDNDKDYDYHVETQRPIIEIEYLNKIYKLTTPFYGGTHFDVGDEVYCLINPDSLEYLQIDGEYQDSMKLAKFLYITFKFFAFIGLFFCLAFALI